MKVIPKKDFKWSIKIGNRFEAVPFIKGEEKEVESSIALEMIDADYVSDNSMSEEKIEDDSEMKKTKDDLVSENKSIESIEENKKEKTSIFSKKKNKKPKK